MDSEEISDRVWEFIAEKIDSVPQLEALLLMWEDPDHAWSAEELAKRVYVPTDAAARILQELQRRGLLRPAEQGPSSRYRYDARWDTSQQRMSEVAAAYRRHVVQVATFIHSRASSSVREFARAFDLKKER